MESEAQVIAAAGNPIRLAIATISELGVKCISERSKLVDAKKSKVSRRLAALLNDGLVTQHKKGVKAIYSSRTPCLLKSVHNM